MSAFCCALKILFYLMFVICYHMGDVVFDWYTSAVLLRDHLRESGFQNPQSFRFWNLESWALESGIQLQECGILLTIGIRNRAKKKKKLESSPFGNPESSTRNPGSTVSRIQGCLPFVRINRLGWPLNNGKGFFKISKPTERDAAYHLKFDFPYNCFRLMRDWKLKNLANGKDISAVPFRTEKEDYLWRWSTISERIFRKITVPFDFQPKFPDFFTEW